MQILKMLTILYDIIIKTNLNTYKYISISNSPVQFNLKKQILNDKIHNLNELII